MEENQEEGKHVWTFIFYKDMELHYYPTIQMAKGRTDVQQTALWICTHAQDKHAEI